MTDKDEIEDAIRTELLQAAKRDMSSGDIALLEQKVTTIRKLADAS